MFIVSQVYELAKEINSTRLLPEVTFMVKNILSKVNIEVITKYLPYKKHTPTLPTNPCINEIILSGIKIMNTRTGTRQICFENKRDGLAQVKRKNLDASWV